MAEEQGSAWTDADLMKTAEELVTRTKSVREVYRILRSVRDLRMGGLGLPSVLSLDVDKLKRFIKCDFSSDGSTVLLHSDDGGVLDPWSEAPHHAYDVPKEE